MDRKNPFRFSTTQTNNKIAKNAIKMTDLFVDYLRLETAVVICVHLLAHKQSATKLFGNGTFACTLPI